MDLLNENTKLQNFVIDLAIKAAKESKIHPVDREFLLNYLDEILSFDSKEFIFHNFELENDLYSNQLFVCLPEVWQRITIDDILEMSAQFTSVHSYFALLRFTYKYIEIDILELILCSNKVHQSPYLFLQILEYLQLQWNVLLKSESDLEDFSDGFIDVNYDEWRYIKQKFLLDERAKPALLDIDDTKRYIMKLVLKYSK